LTTENRFKKYRIFLISIFLISVCSIKGFGQQAVGISESLDQHIFSFGEIEFLEDPNESFTIQQVSSNEFKNKFKPSEISTPHNTILHSVYWYRIKIKHNPAADKNYILEFFDQTIDNIIAYIPTENGDFHQIRTGDQYSFNQRQLDHKNFEIILDNEIDSERIYYFRIKSSQTTDVIIVLRSVSWFIKYALNEYFTFGIFYGMILVFSFYNLMMFIAIRQRQYLYYVAYNMSIGLYEMCTDGIAYQYLWPNFPEWNQYAYGVALYLVSVFALLFTRKLLNVKTRAPRLFKLINWTIAIRSIIFLICLIFNKNWFNYKAIEFVPLIIAFYTGIYIFIKGYRPARFFVLGYSFLFFGFTLKFLITLGYSWLNFGVISYYSLTVCFVIEMIFLAFAIGDKVRLLKKKKDKAQRRIINQMKINDQLKDTINKELETQVQQRTRETVEKSAIIATQNEELVRTNTILKEQAGEITRMNTFLEQDNIELHTSVEKISLARIMSADVDFEEFSKIYPDPDSCYKFLSDLKWSQGYICRKCGCDHYFHGHLPYARRCAKCSYEESVIANTVFQNTRVLITKAFYMIFLIYSSKGKVSSHKLSEILGIRQSTCWTYSSRIKKLMIERKKELRNAGEKGWSKLVLEKS
jgi:two-component system, sensor histidine kinase LadS